jgi:hypothetical protein
MAVRARQLLLLVDADDLAAERAGGEKREQPGYLDRERRCRTALREAADLERLCASCPAAIPAHADLDQTPARGTAPALATELQHPFSQAELTHHDADSGGHHRKQ